MWSYGEGGRARVVAVLSALCALGAGALLLAAPAASASTLSPDRTEAAGTPTLTITLPTLPTQSVTTTAPRTSPAPQESTAQPTNTAPETSAPSRTEAPPPAPQPPTSDETGLPVLAVVLALVGTALVAGAIGWVLGRQTSGRHGPASHPTPPHPPVPATAAPQASGTGTPYPARGGLVDDLVDGLIAGYDLATNDGQRARALAALRRAGIDVLQPMPGDVFDPTAHLALGTVQATGPDQVGRIARTERPGWRRGDELVRHPEVVVWQ